MTKDQITSEIARELAMRRKVWREIPGSPGVFPDTDHTRQYAAMQAALLVFQTMHAAEFQLILNRAERLRREQEAQATLEL